MDILNVSYADFMSLEPLERAIHVSIVANAPQMFPRNYDATKLCYKARKRLTSDTKLTSHRSLQYKI